MVGIKFLGSGGSVSRNNYTTCIQVTEKTLIDAGNIMHALGKKAQYISNIFLSHSHLDHIIDIAFLLDNFFDQREETLKIYGLPETIKAVREDIYNNTIWPDFTKVIIPNSSKPSLKFIPIQIGEKYEVEDQIFLTPFESVHSVPCCGYIIEKDESALLYSGDTFQNKRLWEYINSHHNITALIIDVSFPNRLKKVAQESKHLTAAFLEEDRKNLTRDDLKIYVNHIKPLYKQEVIANLKAIGIDEEAVIEDGDIITYKNAAKIRTEENIQKKIARLNNIGISLTAEQDIDRLLENIVTQTKKITGADGGTLYLVDGDKLVFKVVQTDTLGIKMGGKSGAITWPSLPMYLEDGTPNNKMVAVMCALEGKIINIADVYIAEGFSFEGTKKFDKSTGYRSKSMLVIPLRNHEKKVIGVLQLINKEDMLNNKIISFTNDDEMITLSLASQAAVSITKAKLIADLEILLESFLKSIIYAIGKKSPYTAGHIRRMVALSLMLAKGVSEDRQTYDQVHYTDDEIKEINFAALMHDIGKLATPEQVVDKATKLETIYDRIHIVQMRIELIKKEFEIAYLKKEISKEDFEKNTQELDNYFNIIEQSNAGSEYTPDESIALFEMLKTKVYRINGKAYKVLTKDEAYNLSVRKGTLTEEERQIINDHAAIGLEILQKLPFPEKYKEIPDIAGSHHEKINGTGYPRGLKGDEISFKARILAIADIFEALTASDRPYKKANKLSTAMKILYTMTKDNELDKGLVKYFYKSDIYKKYAQKFLSKKNIDAVDIDFDDL
ncbi:Chemotactic transducer-related protein [hydrothermal vent metagenome]|uniref:Chemotactic transducer-related protein n=1 Tax=hydrothermal vent metagenome TaxID=652676 RepID=A0A1W1CJV2_9ZZZZ